jgi:hypothetical protein
MERPEPESSLLPTVGGGSRASDNEDFMRQMADIGRRARMGGRPDPYGYRPYGAEYPPDDGSDDISQTSLLVVAIIVLVIIIVVFYIYSPCTLARNLASSGWVVYYRKDCGFCTKQKEYLKGFKNYVECGLGGQQVGGRANPPLACNSPEIVGFPFWYNTKTGKSRTGLQDAEALELMTL